MGGKLSSRRTLVLELGTFVLGGQKFHILELGRAVLPTVVVLLRTEIPCWEAGRDNFPLIRNRGGRFPLAAKIPHLGKEQGSLKGVPPPAGTGAFVFLQEPPSPAPERGNLSLVFTGWTPGMSCPGV